VCYLFKTKRKNNQKKKFPTASLQTSGSLTVVKGQHGLASITKMWWKNSLMTHCLLTI